MRLVLTLLHQRNSRHFFSIRRQKKAHMGAEKKPEIHSSCMVSRGRCSEDSRKWQSSKSWAASFQTDRSCDGICQLKGHGNSQDTKHQAETTNRAADWQKTFTKRELRRSSAQTQPETQRSPEFKMTFGNKQVATVTMKGVAGMSQGEAGGDQGFFSAILKLMRRWQRKMS